MKIIFCLLISLFVATSMPAQKEEVKLVIQQESELYHKPLGIQAYHLPAKTKVKVSLQAVDAKNHVWNSEAFYLSDHQGMLDLTVFPSLGGSYLGVHPMGLFWSLKSDDYHQIATNKGFDATITLSIADKTLAQQTIYRKSTRELADLKIKGQAKRDSITANYYLPKSDQKRPALIFLGGSGGNFRQERVSLYASEGFAVLDLKYFKGENLPDGIIEIPLEYVQKAHNWLRQQPEIDATKIGIVGRSRGSELALLYAAKFDMSFVIAQVPSNVVWFGWADHKSSWSYQNKPFPYAEYSDEDSERIELEMKEKGIPYHDGPKFLSAFKDTTMMKQAAIPVEEINCPILLISGKEDKVWPSTMMADKIVARLQEKDFNQEFIHLAYENAGHNFAGGGQGCGIPFLPAEDYSNSSAKGGSDQGNALAAIHSWQEILQFIHRHLQ